MSVISISASSGGTTNKIGYQLPLNNYLFGSLVEFIKNDLFYTPEIPSTDEMHTCLLESEDTGEERYCYWFKWDGNGLVVDPIDGGSMEDAIVQFLSKII